MPEKTINGSSRHGTSPTPLQLIENELRASVALGSEDRDVRINEPRPTNDVLDVGLLHLEPEIQFRYLFRMVWERIPGFLFFPDRNS